MTLDELIATLGVMKPGGRDTTAAANVLMTAKDEWLLIIAKRDPDMIRDVAAALVYERTRPE